MRELLVVVLALLTVVVIDEVYAKGTFFDTVRFVQYLDENTALEEVRNGNLDIYYSRIPSDRLDATDGLRIFDSAGSSYSILVNPAESKEFNPFSLADVRFALNYIIDRELVVNELMDGYGSPIISRYGLSDPEYMTVIEQLESFDFRYNHALANNMIGTALEKEGAAKIGGIWHVDGKPIEVTIFIRSDDPIRKSMGEILVTELQRVGFVVKKDLGDLNKAFVVVYGSDPADLKWSLYTEGWASSAFVRYDSVGLSQMYSPWFSNMPGFNNPSYWNYENDKLDNLTQRIYTGDFATDIERMGLVRDAVVEGIGESVRIFVAGRTDQYVANPDVTGIINDFGAGVPNRFTPINARGDRDEFVIGVKQIYQGAWNPVMGITDIYSRHIWGIISDPGVFKHPFTSDTIPVRAQWQVETAGPSGTLDVPDETIMWNPVLQEWENVAPDSTATSKVTFDYKFGRWHSGEEMDMNDILYSLYFAAEWGTQTDNYRTYDAEYTPRAAQHIQTIIGINPLDSDTVEVYVNYWHFDEGEIAGWADIWSTVPWEIYAAMEAAVVDGKTSFSKSGATGKNISWLSLIIPNDARIINEYLQGFRDSGHVPAPLGEDSEYFKGRYDSTISWIEKKNHAVISNGPFQLESYSPESRTITTSAFTEYPLEAGRWGTFEEIDLPVITNVEIPKSVKSGEGFEVVTDTKNSDAVIYFLTGRDTISSGRLAVENDSVTIQIPPEDTVTVGSSSIKIFAVSDSVLRPDFYESGFIITDHVGLPENSPRDVKFVGDAPWYGILVVPVLAVVVVLAYLARRLKPKVSGD